MFSSLDVVPGEDAPSEMNEWRLAYAGFLGLQRWLLCDQKNWAILNQEIIELTYGRGIG